MPTTWFPWQHIHYLISFFSKLPNLTALSLLSHLPLIKHLPDPFLMLCRQYNSFHSCLLNEMGKCTHTLTHTHNSLGVCVGRGISAVFQDQGMQVAGMCSIYIYTHTHSAFLWHILCWNVPRLSAQSCHVSIWSSLGSPDSVTGY